MSDDRSAGMHQWEFTAVTAKTGAMGVDRVKLVQQLNDSGAQGWQCAGVVTGSAGEQVVILQRPVRHDR